MKTLNNIAEMLQDGAIQKIEAATQDEAIIIVKSFYSDQTPEARGVLTENSWKPAAVIVGFLLQKFPEIQPIIKDWWEKIKNKASEKWMQETGERLY